MSLALVQLYACLWYGCNSDRPVLVMCFNLCVRMLDSPLLPRSCCCPGDAATSGEGAAVSASGLSAELSAACQDLMLAIEPSWVMELTVGVVTGLVYGMGQVLVWDEDLLPLCEAHTLQHMGVLNPQVKGGREGEGWWGCFFTSRTRLST